MKQYIEKRAMDIGVYIVDKNATVRQAAKAFGVSKSTVHKDVCNTNGFEKVGFKVVVE